MVTVSSLGNMWGYIGQNFKFMFLEKELVGLKDLQLRSELGMKGKGFLGFISS